MLARYCRQLTILAVLRVRRVLARSFPPDRPGRRVLSMEGFPPVTAQLKVRVGVAVAPVVNVPCIQGDRGSFLVERANTVAGPRIVRIARIVLGKSRCSKDRTESDDNKKLFHGRSPVRVSAVGCLA